MSYEAWGDGDEFEMPDGWVTEDQCAEVAKERFVEGLCAMREMLARFVEQGGDTTTAASLRANWNPEWGTDPVAPASPLPAPTGSMTPPKPLPTAAAWQTIESAPHGGGAELVTDPAWVNPPEVLLLFEGGKRCVGRWDAYYGPGGAGESETRGCGWLEALTLEPVTLHIGEPTHWMPLPEPPQ